jgi:hypothetical protein
VAGVHRRKSEDIPAEGAIGRRILAVEDYMRTKDHEHAFLGPGMVRPAKRYSAILLNICQHP